MATLVSIGDFARMTFLSVKALRHYHEVGVLPPAHVDPESGYRRYDLEQVPTAQVIRRLRELGMPLEDVRHVIDAADVPSRNAAISAHLQRMEGQLEQTRETVKSLRLLLDTTAPPSIAVAYRSIGPTRAIAIRDEVDHDDMFEWLDVALTELRTALHECGGRRTGPDAALYSSALLEEEHGEIMAFVPLEAPVESERRIEQLHLPVVEYAVAVHEGPFESADRTYAALGAVVAERAIGVRGPILENYLVGGFETPDEAKHRTEICWPVFQTAAVG